MNLVFQATYMNLEKKNTIGLPQEFELQRAMKISYRNYYTKGKLYNF